MDSPLSPQVFDLLVALARGPQHGYGLMQRIEAQYGGSYRPSPGVVYANLQRLVDWKWAEEAPAPPGSTDARRKHYRLTPQGLAAAQKHAAEQAAHFASAAQVLGGA